MSLVEIVHALPHRVHVRAPLLADHPEAGARVARSLAQDPACERVSVRERTGSIVVHRETGTLDPAAVARRVAELLQTERDAEGRPLTSPRRSEAPGPTRVARAVAQALGEINGDVRIALDG